MKLLLCQNGQAFLDRYESLLLPHEPLYTLILGNARANLQTTACPSCFFGAVYAENAQSPLLLFGHMAPFRLLLHSFTADAALVKQAAALLCQYILENQIDIAGVLASESLANAFLSCDHEHTYRRGHGMDIMELRRVKESPLAPGQMRQAEPADIALLASWLRAFNQEAVGSELAPEKALTKAKEKLPHTYIYEDTKRQPVCMAIFTRFLTHGTSIADVYTSPEKRGNGYCRSLIQEMCKLRLAAGDNYLSLFVDKANPISNHTYKKVGFQILEDSIEYDRL